MMLPVSHSSRKNWQKYQRNISNGTLPGNIMPTLHPCFVASMHYAERVQYLLDILLQGSSHEKQQLLNGKEVTALGEAIERCKETEEAA